MMGHFIRFVNNRDLACENIMTAYVRTRLILASPPGTIERMASVLEERGTRLPDKSVIGMSANAAKLGMSGRGLYSVKVETTRRNHRVEDMTRTSRYQGIVRDYKVRVSQDSTPPDPSSCCVSINGIKINGWAFKQGSHVEYATGGGGGGEGLKLGTVNMFYTFGIHSRKQCTYVEVTERPILEKIRSLYVIDAIDRNEARLDGFGRVPSGETSMIHISSIRCKLKILPHFTSEDKLIGLRMCSNVQRP